MKKQNSPVNKNNKRKVALANLEDRMNRFTATDSQLSEARTLRERITPDEVAAAKRTKKRRG